MLYITLALPNPAGRDRTSYGPPSNVQLNHEWVEFANIGSQTSDMSGVGLFHYTFDTRCQKTGEAPLISFTGLLGSGYSIRVHSGRGELVLEGTVWHFFRDGSNYVWNNACGDTAVLRNAAQTLVDWARYAPNPADGCILQRQQGTNNLV